MKKQRIGFFRVMEEGERGEAVGEAKTVGNLLQVTNPQTTLCLLLTEAKSQFHTTEANDTTKHMSNTTLDLVDKKI